MPNYRLSPDVSHPVHIQDVAAALIWVHASIQQYGGDPQQIFVMGWSTGGYLATLFACDPTYLQKHGLSLKHIRGVVSFSEFFHVDRVVLYRWETIWGRQGSLALSVFKPICRQGRSFDLFYADGDTSARRQESELTLSDDVNSLHAPPHLVYHL